MSRKSLSRRSFLRGSGGIVIALPFLEAMIPTFARAQALQAKRFIVAFNGSVTSRYAIPTAVGPLSAPLGLAWESLEPVKRYLSVVSNMMVPVYNPSLNEPFIPGGSHSGQHGYTRGPALSGMGSYDAMQIPQACKTATQPGNQTCDQYAADAFGGATKFRSLQLKVQAVPYNGNPSASNGSMSARKQNGVVSDLAPIVSPQAIFDMLFSGGAGGGGGGTVTPPPSTMLAREKSVLDLVLEDANRLKAMLGGEDKARMEIHFDEIRNVEKSIAAQMSGGGTPPPPVGTCTAPARPGADPAVSTLSFGGWANETLRGQVQADLIAYAIACDLTRVVSWMITHDQCWLNSFQTSGSTVVPNGGGVPDVHSDSHSSPPEITAGNCNWQAALFGRLISNLASKSDAGGLLLNNTFMSLISAEGSTAHSRSNLTTIVAGNPGKINLGMHYSTNSAHPAQIQISGLQSIGVNMNNTMGQVSGTMAGLVK